jgi:serine/threonine-protein kinase
VKRVVVPELGGTRKSAESALRAVGLFARFKERDSSEPTGQVIGSDPRRGRRVPARSTVTVLVSGGRPTCRVPDVTGKTGELARSLLSAAQLKSETQEVPSEKPVGTVLSQSENGGEDIECGATVTLSVSTGAQTTPPDAGTGG